MRKTGRHQRGMVSAIRMESLSAIAGIRRNALRAVLTLSDKSASSLPKTLQRPARLMLGAMLLPLAMSLTACAQNPLPQSQGRSNPLPPALSQSMPSQTYSASAQADMAKWRKRLTDTQTTPKP